MKIYAKLDADGSYNLYLNDAPPNAVAEVRWQNTLSGATKVETTETKADGSSSLASINGFGQHCVPTVRILTDKGTIELHTFAYANEKGSNDLLLVQSGSATESKATTTQTEQPVITTQHEEEN